MVSISNLYSAQSAELLSCTKYIDMFAAFFSLFFPSCPTAGSDYFFCFWAACLAWAALAVIMLASHFYESRDGSTGGFFADNTNAAQQVWNTVNLLLRLDRNWKV